MRSAGALLGLLVIGSLVFTACDGDDDTIGNAGSGGTGAKGGKGGSSGKGGSNAGDGADGGSTAARGGTGGTSADTGGTAGTSPGTGGSNRGGTSGRGGSSARGGSSGTAGDAGASGSSASAGEDGSGGSTAGMSGAGGTSGVGGTGIIGVGGAGAGGEAGSASGEAGTGGGGPAPSPKACTYQCDQDDDCDPDNGYTCVNGQCLDAERACNTHEDCEAWATSLTETCAVDSDCLYHESFGDLCMDVGGNGFCVMVPYDDACAFGEATLAAKFGVAETATVCLDLSGRCDAHQCFRGCTSDPAFCTTTPNNKRGPVCNTVTGKCGGCTGDGQCGGTGTSHCNVETGVCGCQGDGECAGLAGMAACVAGTCSCSASSCTTFPDATPICQ